MMPVPDPKTGRMPSCVRRVNSQGDMILSQDDINSGKHFIPIDEEITVVDGTSFETNPEINPVEAARWEAIKNHPWIAKSRFERNSKGDLVIDGGKSRYGTADLYIEEEGKESEVLVTRTRKRVKAQNYVLEDNEQGLRTKAKVLGRPMKLAHVADVTDFLLKESEKNPDKIIDLYEGSSMKYRILLTDALEKRTIIIKNGLYIYGDSVNLGASDDMVLDFFKNPVNRGVVNLILKEVYPNLVPQSETTVLETNENLLNEEILEKELNDKVEKVEKVESKYQKTPSKYQKK